MSVLRPVSSNMVSKTCITMFHIRSYFSLVLNQHHCDWQVLLEMGAVLENMLAIKTRMLMEVLVMDLVMEQQLAILLSGILVTEAVMMNLHVL